MHPDSAGIAVCNVVSERGQGVDKGLGDGLSTPYILSVGLLHNALILPALNLSILDPGLLIMVRLMMFLLNKLDYPMSFLLLSTWIETAGRKLGSVLGNLDLTGCWWDDCFLCECELRVWVSAGQQGADKSYAGLREGGLTSSGKTCNRHSVPLSHCSALCFPQPSLSRHNTAAPDTRHNTCAHLTHPHSTSQESRWTMHCSLEGWLWKKKVSRATSSGFDIVLVSWDQNNGPSNLESKETLLKHNFLRKALVRRIRRTGPYLMALCRFKKKCNWEAYTPIK